MLAFHSLMAEIAAPQTRRILLNTAPPVEFVKCNSNSALYSLFLTCRIHRIRSLASASTAAIPIPTIPDAPTRIPAVRPQNNAALTDSARRMSRIKSSYGLPVLRIHGQVSPARPFVSMVCLSFPVCVCGLWDS